MVVIAVSHPYCGLPESWQLSTTLISVATCIVHCCCCICCHAIADGRHAKREELKAKRKRARERWHKAMRMVSRANRVKKITGMIKFVPPAKGQSLNERLQTLENASRKNTSAIARMENSIEALNDSVKNKKSCISILPITAYQGCSLRELLSPLR